MPTAHVVELPNANHFVFLSNEADVLREIRDFVAGPKLTIQSAAMIVLTSISFVFRALIVARVVLVLKLAFRLQPLVQVVVQVAKVTATFDVNL